MPQVSVITPVYNTALYLLKAVESVKVQEFSDWELILIDDQSVDGSWKLLQQLAASDSRIRIYQNEKNIGSGASRNKAIKLARGRYIAFLDSDDCWTPDKLKLQIHLMKKEKRVMSHASYGYMSREGKPYKKIFHVSLTPVGYIDILKCTEISCSTAVYDSHILGKVYMTEHRLKQDYGLWLSILKKGYKSYPIDCVLAYYRLRPHSATGKKSKLILKHIRFLIETQNMGIIPALYYTSRWIINGIRRYYFLGKIDSNYSNNH